MTLEPDYSIDDPPWQDFCSRRPGTARASSALQSVGQIEQASSSDDVKTAAKKVPAQHKSCKRIGTQHPQPTILARPVDQICLPVGTNRFYYHLASTNMSTKKSSSKKAASASHRSTISLQKTEIHINVYDLLPVSAILCYLRRKASLLKSLLAR